MPVARATEDRVGHDKKTNRRANALPLAFDVFHLNVFPDKEAVS